MKNNEVHDAQGPIIAGGRLARIMEKAGISAFKTKDKNKKILKKKKKDIRQKLPFPEAEI